MIVCLAVVGRNQEPLFLRCYTDPDSEGANDAALRLHYIVHSSLDLVSEHARSVGRKVASDMFLGHLFPVEDYCVYGYLTSTHVKILAVLEDNDRIREADLQTLLTTIHEVYVCHQRNPFAPLAQPITSERFQLAVDRQVNAYNADCV